MGSNPIPSAINLKRILPHRGFFDFIKQAFTNAGSSHFPPTVASLPGSQDNILSQTFCEKGVFDIMIEGGLPRDLGDLQGRLRLFQRSQ
jgi:hypothetical protein